MTKEVPLTREERLALKLRENLRRRKAQARALGGGDVSGSGGSTGDDENVPPALPNPPAGS